MDTFLSLIIKSAYAVGRPSTGGRSTTGDDIVGTITAPTGIPSEVTGTTAILSAVVRFLVIIAGIFALWQFLSGGLQFITSGGDKGKLTEAQQKIQMSLVGLVIIAASFIIIAIISQILFGDFNAILVPQLQSVQ